MLRLICYHIPSISSAAPRLVSKSMAATLPRGYHCPTQISRIPFFSHLLTLPFLWFLPFGMLPPTSGPLHLLLLLGMFVMLFFAWLIFLLFQTTQLNSWYPRLRQALLLDSLLALNSLLWKLIIVACLHFCEYTHVSGFPQLQRNQEGRSGPLFYPQVLVQCPPQRHSTHD